MNGNDAKPWDRPWSMDEIIEQSDKWNLAGDAALLATVSNFANNLLTRTSNLNNNIEGLLNSLNETAVKLDLAQNEFSSLRNCQFIESRVYEDDETLETEQPQEQNESVSEDRDKKITEIISTGLEIMDKYYDKVTVPVSDSEDDEETNYVLKPKDLYVNRPLPYIIGTDEWHKESHIGLEDSEVESESEKSLEEYSSDSESDVSLTSQFSKRNNIKASESSSELDISAGKSSSGKPVANSTFNDSSEPVYTENDSSNAPPEPSVSTSFAEQLSAKLGKVVQDIPEPEVNTRPMQKPAKSGFGLFSDEPPPLDDFEDTVLPNSAQTGLFSGGKGLFDDDDDEPDLFTVNNKPEENKPVKQATNLFDSDSDDEDMWSGTKELKKQPFLQPFKPSVPLLEDEPPEIQKPAEIKKPVGGVSLFGDVSNLNKLLKKRRDSSSDSSEAEPPKVEEQKSKASLFDDNGPGAGAQKVKTSLFDDESPVKPQQGAEAQKVKISLFDDDSPVKPQQAAETQKVKTSLFDDDSPVKPQQAAETQKVKTSLFDDDSPVKTQQRAEAQKIKTSLFDDDLFEDDLFASVPKKKFTSSLFDDDDDDSIFDDKPKVTSKPVVQQQEVAKEDNIKERTVIGAEKPKKTVSLFDDDPPSDDDDLFKLPKKSLFGDEDEEPFKNPEVTIKDPSEQSEKSRVSLFDSTPPPDDEWDNTDNIFNERDDYNYNEGQDSTVQRSDLSNVGPPSLIVTDSGIGVGSNTIRSYTDGENSFVPDASSSRRLSSEIFSDEDSVFITHQPPSLERIPESPPPDLDTVSYMEITPSGNLEELERGADSDKHSDDVDGEIERVPPAVNDDMNVAALKEKLLAQSADNNVVMRPKKPGLQPPGRLRHSLNINVGALLPGTGPPKVRPVSAVFEQKNDEIEKAPSSEIKVNKEEESSSGILHSITKDRAKIQVKRRPSTKRGREILRNSVVDFNEEYPIEEDPEKKDDKPDATDIISAPPQDIPKPIADDVKKSEVKADIFDDGKSNVHQEVKEVLQTDNIVKPSATVEKEVDDIFSDIAPSKSLFDAPKGLFEDVTHGVFDDVTDKPQSDAIKPISHTDDFTKPPITTDKEIEDIFSEAVPSKPLFDPPKGLFDDVKQNVEAKSDNSNKKTQPERKIKSTTDKEIEDIFSEAVPSKPLFDPPKGLFEDVKQNVEVKSDNSNKKTQPEKKTKSSIFDSEDEDDDLFTSKSKVVKEPPKTTKKSLFDSEDEDDDLFAPSVKPLKVPLKKNLFGDDEDEDLFGSSSSSSKTGLPKKETIKKPTNLSVKKLENKETDDDPLSEFWK